MKDAYYIKLDTNIREDPKVKLLIKNYNLRGFGSFISVILTMRYEADTRLEYSDFVFEALAVDLDWSAKETRQFIDDCIDKFHLFKKQDGYFFSERLQKDVAVLEERREQARQAGLRSSEKRWGKPATATNDLGKMFEVYEEKIGKPITNKDSDILKDIADTYPSEEFEKAVDEAVKQGKRTLSYISGILENWHKKEKPARRSYSDSKKDDMMEEE